MCPRVSAVVCPWPTCQPERLLQLVLLNGDRWPVSSPSKSSPLAPVHRARNPSPNHSPPSSPAIMKKPSWWKGGRNNHETSRSRGSSTHALASHAPAVGVAASNVARRRGVAPAQHTPPGLALVSRSGRAQTEEILRRRALLPADLVDDPRLCVELHALGPLVRAGARCATPAGLRGGGVGWLPGATSE